MTGHELSIFFDLKDAPRRGYEAQAWKVFMRHSNPEMLKDSQFFHGDVSGLAPGADHLYCIAVRTKNPATIRYLKKVFAACDDKRLAPFHDRLRESAIVQKYQLKFRGRMDDEGCFETQEWSRVDHELCQATGWPYVPHTYPKHISPELLDELERMATPGRKTPDRARNSTPGLKSVPAKKRSSGAATSWLRAVLKILVMLLVAGVLVGGWLMRDKISEKFRERKEALSLKLEVGSKAHAKYRKGFALAGIAKVPHDLDIAVLNKKLQDRAYYALPSSEESSCDASMYCTVWSSAQEMSNPSLQTTIQAFIRIEMSGRNGTALWFSQSKGVRSAPGSEKANPNLRYEALSAAIENIDLFCLIDGKSVRSLQANNDYDGLRKHAQHLMAQCRNKPDDPCGTAKADAAALENELRGHMEKQWIMTNHVYMKTGKEFSALILEENSTSYRLRMQGGTTSIAKSQIDRIEPFGAEQFAAEINDVMQPLRKGLKCEWQRDVCDALAKEVAEKCATYGPPVPNMHVVSIKSDETTGDLMADVKTAKDRKTVKVGDKLQGLNVVGIDAETNTVIVRMGRKGDILRAWPRESPPQGGRR